MKRREFIAGLGGAAVWPLVGRTQQQMPTIGFLSLNPVDNFLTVFRQNLKAVGYVEGQNVASNTPQRRVDLMTSVDWQPTLSIVSCR